ncbi:MAG TPA: glycosyltransferase [Acidimicrobiales bacterium]|nr:glycosyltransferase [Acidimicrobiales bacterium]
MTTGGRSRIVVATPEGLAARMAGPAIRAWHMAEALAAEHDVQLVTPGPCGRRHPAFRARQAGAGDWPELERWMDVLVFQGGLLHDHPFLRRSEKVVVADVYDPFHLESLEQTRGWEPGRRADTVRRLTEVLNEQLRRGDFLLCAAGRQRDFWLGSLAALGRVNPATYDEDVDLASLLAVVPFGLPPEPPVATVPAMRGVVPGIGPGDKIVLWAGGVYNWFDPLTLVEAVDRLRRRLPAVRLFFLGLQHPNPDIPPMRMATALRELAAERGLVGTHVFFNEGWVDYDARAGYLLEADVGVSTHFRHLETAYSFRSRILDYLWAGLPVVATGGDTFADLIETEGLGAAVAPGDVEGLEEALWRLLSDEEQAAACRANVARVAPRYAWPVVLEPLLAFCRAPRRAPDLAAASVAPPAAPAGLAGRMGAAYRDGGAGLVLRRSAASLRRRLARGGRPAGAWTEGRSEP